MRTSKPFNKSFEVKRTSPLVMHKALLCFVWGILLAVSFIKTTALLFLSLAFFIGLGIYVVAKKDKDASTFIEIDKEGIWIHNQLLTDWNNYIVSFIKGEYISDHTSETTVINVEYYKDGERGYFSNQLLFEGTEDKTEYEVIDAIQYFYENRKK